MAGKKKRRKTFRKSPFRYGGNPPRRPARAAADLRRSKGDQPVPVKRAGEQVRLCTVRTSSSLSGKRDSKWKKWCSLSGR